MHAPSSPSTVPAALALAALLACDPGTPDPALAPPGEFTERDSAGVRIVESSGTALETRLPWVVDGVPDLELGAIDGDAHAQFDGISGIVGLDDGGLVVVDAGSAELRWFDADGNHVRTVGRAGDGPGEFRDPLLVPRFERDSLLIFSSGRRRDFTWVAIDGSAVRVVDRAGRRFVGTPETSAGSRALFRSISSGSLSCPENQSCDVPLLLQSIDVSADQVDTLATYVSRVMTFTESGPPALLNGPLDQNALAAGGPDGPVIEGAPHFELRQFDEQNRLTGIFRVAAASRITPQDALRRLVQPARDPDALLHVYELMDIPDVVPSFQALLVDRLGWYWAELFQPDDDGPSEWLVFDPEGRARGLVELPNELEIHEIGEDYTLGLRTDELGVEYVRRHALDRRD